MVETRFYVLLLAIGFVLVGAPPLNRILDPELVNILAWASVFLAGAYAVALTRGGMVVAGLLALAAIVTDSLTYRRPYGEELAVLTHLTDFGILLFATAVLGRRMVESERVTPDTVRGGICIYLLIGFLFVPVFALTETLIPGSFSVSDAALDPVGPGEYGRYPGLVYYSFVTLTTLGYGDIAPLSPEAQSLAALEAIIGQLFIAVFVARLVGLQLAHARAAGDPA